MTQSMMMRSAVHVAPLCVDKMQQQRIDHLGLETVECIFRRSSNMFWGVGVEDWSCKVAEKKRVQHLQVEDLQSSKVVVSVGRFFGPDHPSYPKDATQSQDQGCKSASLPRTPQCHCHRYMNAKSSILVLGLSVHSTPVEMREKLAVPEAEWPHAISELSAQNHITKAAVLSTCNRMEIYVVALSWNRGVQEVTEWMSKTSGIPVEDLLKHLFILRDNDATQHLFRVSAGLDSLDPTKGFLRIFVQNSPYLEKKKLEVARFRQCVSLGRQN